MAETEGISGICLAELIATLSLGTDLGLGHPMEHVLRQCVIALGLGERFGLDEAERSVVYYVALLAWVGCHVDSFEQATWFGDDIAMRADVYTTDLVGIKRARFMTRNLGAGSSAARRARTALEFLISGREVAETMRGTHCTVAGDLAERLGVGAAVRDALLEVFEPLGRQGRSRPARGRRNQPPRPARPARGRGRGLSPSGRCRGRRGGGAGTQRYAVRPRDRGVLLRRRGRAARPT